jgi:DNA-binding CsgD family transcriptional regulator/tetratricopeptide (TPR) repeat protein
MMWMAGQRPTSVSVRTSSPTLVGRDVELGTIVEVVAERPSAVFIGGEAGMGKTRLIAELLRRPELDGVRVLAGSCQPLREPFPYGPILEALRSAGDRPVGPLSPVVGVLRPLLPEIAGLLPPQPEPLADPAAERHRQFRAVRELLTACGPALLVIDDLHWADDGTRDLLRFVVSKMPEQLAVVVTYLDTDGHHRSPLGMSFRPAEDLRAARVSLGPLDVGSIRRLATGLLEVPVSAEFAAKVHEYTAGIPFVAEETVRALRDAAGPPPVTEVLTDHLLDGLEVPVLLREAMIERLNALPEPSIRLTRAAAVLGLPAEPTVIGALAGLRDDELPAAILSTSDGGVLGEVAQGRYGFRYALARKAVYGTISGPERAMLHGRALDLLAGLPAAPLLQLAEHARAAGRLEQWQHHAEAAADQAIAHGETSLAIDVLQSALTGGTLAEQDVARLATKLSQIAPRGFHRDVIATLERVLEDLPLGPATRGTIRLSLGMLLVRTAGQLARGRIEVERAIGELVDRPELAARGINLLALPIDGLTPLTWHDVWMRRAAKAFDRLEDPELRLTLTGDRISSRAHIGEPEAWTDFENLPDSASSVAERVQLAQLWCNMADAQSWVGHLARADRLVTEGTRRAIDAGALYAAGLAQSTRLRLNWVTGNWTGLAGAGEALRDKYSDLGPIVMQSSLVLGALAAARGEFAAAQRYLAATSVLAPQHGPIPVVLAAAGVLIRVRLATGDATGACAVAETAMVAARRKGVWVWAQDLVPTAAEVYAQAGRWDEADAVVEEFARGIEGRDAPSAHAALLTGRAVLLAARGKHQAAALKFDEAKTRYEKLPMPYPATGALERAARSRLAAGERSAIEELTSAAEAYERLGATRDAGRCRRQLREHGAWAPSPRGRRGYGSELSPREREVASMLADGRTNREIADGLFLSPRTVEQHVAKVLRKLGVRSRTEIARQLVTETADATGAHELPDAEGDFPDI